MPQISSGDMQEFIELTDDDVWKILKNRSILLTGGTGFIGKWLLTCLLHANKKLNLDLSIGLLSRNPDAFTAQNPQWRSESTLQLLPGDMLQDGLPTGQYFGIVNAAFPVASPSLGDGGMQALAFTGTRRLLDWADSHGTQRFLHVSSGAVYGKGHREKLTEASARQDPLPANAYTLAKRAAEEECQASRRYGITIARCFSFIGPYQQAESGSAAAQFVQSALRQQPITISGTGQTQRSYQYASDMARWLVTMLTMGKAGVAYNVGSSLPVSIAALAGTIASGVTPPVNVVTGGNAIDGLAGDYYVPNTDLARKHMQLENAVSLEQAVVRTLAWHRSR